MVFQRLLLMCQTVFINFPFQLLLTVARLLFHLGLPAFLFVGAGLDVHSVDEYRAGIRKACAHRFLQNVFKDALEDVRTLEPPDIVLPKYRKVRNRLADVVSDKPSVCHVYFDFPNCLAHTVNAK